MPKVVAFILFAFILTGCFGNQTKEATAIFKNKRWEVKISDDYINDKLKQLGEDPSLKGLSKKDAKEKIKASEINMALTRAEAKKRNISIEKEAIEAKFEQLKKNLGSKYKQAFGMQSDEKIKSYIESRLTFEALQSDLVKDYAVSEKEINEFWTEAKHLFKAGNTQPTLKEARPRVVKFLKKRKADEVILAWLEKAKKEVVIIQ